ncbi:retrovirus-related pol polyprotein from transposon TNT 1-94 [Tanacetum coccineum]
MAHLSEDIQSVGSDTRPPMLDRSDFESWQQRIRLYCKGKDHRDNILKSIDEGPFKMGKFRKTLPEGALHLGPERDRVVADLTPAELERYKVYIRATNILLQGLPKDIYTLINHYTDAKHIWDNVKMLLEGSELTKDERESQQYDEFEHFYQNKGETIHEHYVKFVTEVKLNRGLKTSNYDQLYAYLKQHETHANENKMMLEKFTQPFVDLIAFMSNVSPHQYPSQSSTIPQSAYVLPVTHQPQFVDNTQLDSGFTPNDDLIENLTKNGAVVVGNGGVQNRVGNANLGQAKQIKSQVNGAVLDEEQLLFIAGGQTNTFDDDVDEALVQDLALNEDNIFQVDQCDAFDSDVDEAPTAQTMFMTNLSSADLIYDKAGPSYDSDILSEVQDHDNYVNSVGGYHEVHKMQNDVQPNYVVDSDAEYMSDSNIIPYEQYMKDNAVLVVQSNVSSVPNDALIMIINDMHEQSTQCVYMNEQTKIVNESLTAKLMRYKELVGAYEKRARFELTEREQKIDEQLRIVITDRFIATVWQSKYCSGSLSVSTLTAICPIRQGKCDEIERKNLFIANENLIENWLTQEVFYTAIDFVLTVSRFTEMNDAYTVAQKQTSSDVPAFYSVFVIGKLKEQLQGRGNTIRELKETISRMKKKHSDADPILDFKALDSQNKDLNAKVNALQDLNERFRTENKKAQIEGKMKCVTMPAEKPKFLAPGMYAIDLEPIPPRNSNNKEVHLDYLTHLKESVGTLCEIVEEARVKQPLDNALEYACLYTKHSQKLLEYAIDTCPKEFSKRGVKCSTEASRSKPRSNTKKNKIPLTKSDNKKKVEDHPRNNKSNLKQTNCVDSSISYKRTVVQIVLWYLDSGCSKHMTGNRSRLKNFVKKFIGTVRFENDHFDAIMGYRDYMIGDSMISSVYYVEGLGHNLFSVGQFYDSDLEVAFRKYSCYVRNEYGVDLLKGSHGLNLYTISDEDMIKSSSICLLSKASKNKSWLWYRRLNPLNFGTINDLARKDLTINGKKYILVIVDDYSRFTWVKFLRSKDETPKFVIKFLKQIQVGLNKTVRYIRTDNGIEFNDIVKRRNRTLMEAARTMLLFSKASMFLRAEAVATAFFSALCYPTNDSEDLGKLNATADIGIFVGYAPNRKGYRIYNKITRRIMETIHVQFDELSEPMDLVHISTGPEPILLTPRQISSGLVPNPVPAAPYVPPTNKDLEILFQPMFDEYFETSNVERPVPPALAVQVLVVLAGTPSSTTIDQDAPSISHSPSPSEIQPPIIHQGIAVGPIIEDNPFAHADNDPFENIFAPEPSSEESSSGDVCSV